MKFDNETFLLDDKRFSYYVVRLKDHMDNMECLVQTELGCTLSDAIHQRRPEIMNVGHRYVYRDYPDLDDLLYVIGQYDVSVARVKQQQALKNKLDCWNYTPEKISYI